MATQKFSPFSSNILQPKRLNNSNNINTTPSPNLSDPGLSRRILGQKGQLPSLNNNGISHLSNQQLTTLLRNSPIIEASLGNLNPTNAGSPITSSGCSPCVTTNSTGTKRAPNTMAKRNARERNRVKQVNQGFQTLRHHIPDSYRMKKMSKVDTLRCALDYIRNLERILQLPESQGGDSSPLSSILTSSPNHSTISPSTSLIFSSEEDELFFQGESPSSSFHHHNQSLLSVNTAVDKISCNNTESEMDEPVFAPGLMTSGHKIIILSSLDNSATITTTTASTTYNNEGQNDENSNQENQNLGIKIEPSSPSEGLSSVKDENYRIDVIGMASDGNNGMVVEPILDVQMDMGLMSPSDGQSRGHLSDGHSDIENNYHEDQIKFQYS